MESFLYLFIAFICGIIFNVFWGYALGLGYGTILFRNTVADGLLMMAKNIQSLHEIHKIKYMSYSLLERDEKYIEFQKQIDNNEMRSLKNSVVRNFLNSVPVRYNNLIDFHDWDSAMIYLNNIYNGGNDD